MIRKPFILLLLLLAAVMMQAEIVTLKNGTQVRGQILIQNDEVVILRDASGARYQYPRAEVVSIAEEEQTVVEEEEVKTVGDGHKKKASILLEPSVGAAILPSDGKTGVAYSVDLLVGSHNLADHRIFVGTVWAITVMQWEISTISCLSRLPCVCRSWWASMRR